MASNLAAYSNIIQRTINYFLQFLQKSFRLQIEKTHLTAVLAIIIINKVLEIAYIVHFVTFKILYSSLLLSPPSWPSLLLPQPPNQVQLAYTPHLPLLQLLPLPLPQLWLPLPLRTPLLQEFTLPSTTPLPQLTSVE